MSYEPKCVNMYTTHKASTTIYDNFYFFYLYLLHNDASDNAVITYLHCVRKHLPLRIVMLLIHAASLLLGKNENEIMQ